MAARSGNHSYDDPVNDRFMVDIVRRLGEAEKKAEAAEKEAKRLSAIIESRTRA